MKYARDWALSRLADDKCMAAVRASKSFEPTIPSQAQYIDLDWRYMGFLGPARTEFNFKVVDWDGLEARKVGSVSLTEVRASIIIGLNGDPDLGLEWPAEYLKKLKRVGDEVFVYCGE